MRGAFLLSVLILGAGGCSPDLPQAAPAPPAIELDGRESAALVSWDPVTTNTDGTPATNLAGYRLHWGLASRDYTWHQDTTSTAIGIYELVEPGIYFFTVTSLDTEGNESVFSNEVSKYVADGYTRIDNGGTD